MNQIKSVFPFFIITAFLSVNIFAQQAKNTLSDKYLDTKKTLTSAPVGNGLGEITDNIKKGSRYWKDLGNSARKKLGNLGDGASTVISAIDISSTIGDAAGYMAEGDAAGAWGIVISDLLKKGTVIVTTGAGTMTGVPGGSVVGGAIGEQIHKDLIAPIVDKNTDKERDREYSEKYLMQPPRQSFIDKNGKIRTLPADMYMGKDGLIHRRTAEEQEAFIRKWHKERSEYNRTKSIALERKADALCEALHNDDITSKEFFAGMSGIIDKRSEMVDEAILDLKKLQEKIAEEEKRKRIKKDQELQEIMNFAGKDKKASEDIDKVLKNVKPIRMVADAVKKEEGLKHNLALCFWNVGSMLPGYGKASLAIDIHITGNFEYWGDRKKFPTVFYKGTFSGGPNGRFVLTGETGTITGQMKNGRVITLMDEVYMKVRTPEGFINWPE